MIRFRQKEFVGPIALLGAVSTPLMGAQMIQQHNDSKEAEEAAEKQQEQMRQQNNLIRKQNQKIEELKKANPAVGAAVERVAQKAYAMPALVGNVWKAAKPVFRNGVMDNVAMGVATGGSTYLAGKYIQKKEKEKENGQQQSSSSGIGSKVLGGTAAIAGLGLAAKKGLIPGFLGGNSARLAINKGIMKAGKSMGSSTIMRSGMKDYAKGVEKNLMKTAKSSLPKGTDQLSKEAIAKVKADKGAALKKTIADIGATGKDFKKSQSILGRIANHKGSLAMGAAFGGVPLVLGYKADNSQQQAQVQKTYAIPGAGLVKSAISGIKGLTWNKVSSGVSSLASMGVAGGKNIQKFGNSLIKMGKGQGGGAVSNTTVKVGEWIKKHPTAANWASVVPGVGVGMLAFDGPNKVMEKVGRKVDPGAYAYGDAKNQQIQQ